MDTFGTGTDPAILLIHGAGNNRFAWHDEFCARLAGRFVVRFDCTGASVDAMTRDALRVLDEAGIDRAHVVGLSLGGVVAQELALEYAARVADDATSVRTFIESPFDWGEPSRPRLGEIGMPTLVIHGTQDPMFPLEHGETLANELPDATLLVLPETGHEYPPRRHWDTVASAILQHTR